MTAVPANHHDQAVFRLGTAVYAALAALAAVFYLERMAMLDMSFQTFHILRTGSLQIQSERFGAACTQVFPWLAQAAGLPLKGVLIAYSLGHVLYYFVIFTLIVRVMGVRMLKIFSYGFFRQPTTTWRRPKKASSTSTR